MRAKLVLSLLACLSFSACSLYFGEGSDLIRLVDGQGPLVLSKTNQYLAANQLVALESSQSPVMKGFLKNKGNPTAISVETDYLGKITYNYYYPEDGTYYLIERNGDTYAIQGPARLPDSTAATLIRTQEISSATANNNWKAGNGALRGGENYGSGTSGLKETPLVENDIATSNLESDILSDLDSPVADISRDSDSVLARLKQRSDQPAAERTPKGDLVHYVSGDAETIEVIALWYTGDPANSEEIARTNEKAAGDVLNTGDSIIVPSYLVQHGFQLDEDAARQIIGLVQ
jgi:hypothetical protein